MARKTSSEHGARATRFGLHCPVYFRKLGSPTWLKGITENVSYTGVLFQSPSSLSLNTTLELRLQIATPGKNKAPAEIRGKGVVVRLGQKNVPEMPVALAVAMRDCRIVRQPAITRSTATDAWAPRPPEGLA